jgi:biotin transport system substrate-specific component
MFNTACAKNGHLNFLFKKIKLHQAITVFLGSTFIALSSQVTIPLAPVPVTLQTFAILIISALFGPKIGSKMVLLYLFEGICGLPVFANFSSGAAVLLGPTGGYLAGFVGAVYLTGFLLQHGWAKNRLLIFTAALLGHVVLFTSGYLVLASFVGYSNAYLFGIAPFYLADIAKLLLFTLVIPPFFRKKD